MGIETIAAWSAIITVIITTANLIIKHLAEKNAMVELKISLRFLIIGILGSIFGLFVWVLGSPILGKSLGYGTGAIVASVIGGLAISYLMCIFMKRNAGKLDSNKAVFAVVWIVMASIYWTVAWFSLNDLYNTKLTGLAESSRGTVSNIIGWGLAGVIGNTALLPIANFIDMIFKPANRNEQ
jgi:hypothetical protein